MLQNLQYHVKCCQIFEIQANVVKVLNSSEHTDYATQVNLGVQNAKSKWVSLFEHDDEYSFIWFKNVNDYIKYHPECDGFLPIVVDVDESDVFAGYTNEATFAASFNTEIGILTNDLLNQYYLLIVIIQ